MRTRTHTRTARERTARSIRSHVNREQAAFLGVFGKQEEIVTKRKSYVVPDWMKKGAKVHYSSVIGEAPTDPAKMDATVLEDPFQVNGPKGTWVTIIDKHRGWVACEALTLAPEAGIS